MTRSEFSLARIEALAASLSDRDRLVLDTLSRVRLATAEQLQRLHFTDVGHRERRRVLANLAAKKLLYQLPRTIGGVRAGSAGHVYALGTSGQRLRRNRTRSGRAKRPWTPGTTFLEHSLAITQALVELSEAEADGQLRVRRFETEPVSWRDFGGRGGVRLTLKPDVYVEVGINGDKHRDHWFIEIDLGTESSTTLHRKCELYRAYWSSGEEELRRGVFPLVLFAVKTDERKGTVIDVLGQQPEDSWPLFTICLLGDTVPRLIRGAA